MERGNQSKVVSPVWDHFGLQADSKGKVIEEEAEVAVCRKCHNHVRARVGNTSNLISHLRVHYPMLHSQLLQAQKKKTKDIDKPSSGTQMSIKSIVNKAQKHSRTSKKKWKELTDSITYCLAKDMLPLHSVEKKGFRRSWKGLTHSMTSHPQSIFPTLQFQVYLKRLEKTFLLIFKVLNIFQP